MLSKIHDLWHGYYADRCHHLLHLPRQVLGQVSFNAKVKALQDGSCALDLNILQDFLTSTSIVPCTSQLLMTSERLSARDPKRFGISTHLDIGGKPTLGQV